jgi:hypothetical protein
MRSVMFEAIAVVLAILSVGIVVAHIFDALQS